MARISRRRLFMGSATAVAAVMHSGRTAVAQGSQEAVEPWKVPGRTPSEIGSRSAHVRLARRVNRALPSGESETPLHLLDGIITPADLHFERHHGGIPAIDPARYQLLIHGLVSRPMVFSLETLFRYPRLSRICFIECSGNGYRGYLESQIRPDLTPQQIDGLTSTSDWCGIPLRLLLREVGVRPGAKWFLAEGADAALMTRSIPIEKGWDDAMIALMQNGEPLRPEQGYPARLLLPGWEGNSSVKWLRRIDVSDRPFMTREETSKYTDPLPDGTARIFSFDMDPKSTITYPTYPVRLRDPGWYEISGLAWSGRGRIQRVDVSADGGQRWERAALDEPVLPKCHTRFRLAWRWTGKPALLMSRAVDETGYVQPTRQELLAVRGPATSYHMNNIRAWQVDADGAITFGVRP
jgi:sulfane dehydrogenase subunit SoxC